VLVGLFIVLVGLFIVLVGSRHVRGDACVCLRSRCRHVGTRRNTYEHL
jgi:hypothetical protein